MDRLAVMESDHDPHRGDQLVATLGHLRRSQLGRAVVCAGRIDGPAAAALADFGREAPGLVVVLTEPDRSEAAGSAGAAGTTGAVGVLGGPLRRVADPQRGLGRGHRCRVGEPVRPSPSFATRQASVAAELGLAALALGTAASFTRLFVGWDFLGRLAPIVVLAWLTAVVLRRFRVGIAVSVVAHLAIGVAALSWWFAAGTQYLGVVPGPATLDAWRDEISRSFAEVPDLVAPVAASNGFLVVIAAGFWFLALFGDTAAFRYRGTVQAAVPYGAVFVATGILARDSGRLVAAGTFGVGVAAYAIANEHSLRASSGGSPATTGAAPGPRWWAPRRWRDWPSWSARSSARRCPRAPSRWSICGNSARAAVRGRWSVPSSASGRCSTSAATRSCSGSGPQSRRTGD